MLLVFVAKKITASPQLDETMLSAESLKKLLDLTVDAEQSRIPVYEGILQLFCRCSYTAETKAMIETTLSQIAPDTYANNRVLT